MIVATTHAAGALDLFADLSGSSGSQAAQAAAEAAGQPAAAGASGKFYVPLSSTSENLIRWLPAPPRWIWQLPEQQNWALMHGLPPRIWMQHTGCECLIGRATSAGQQPAEQRQGRADDLLVGRDYASRILQG